MNSEIEFDSNTSRADMNDGNSIMFGRNEFLLKANQTLFWQQFIFTNNFIVKGILLS